MGNAVKILWSWAREFVPALKTECLIVGWGLIAMSICLINVCVTSGLSGKLTYMVLHPGVTFTGLGAGLALLVCAYTWSPVPPEEM